MSLTDYQKNFLRLVADVAKEECPLYDIPWLVCVAQAALESGYGWSKAARDDALLVYQKLAERRYNLFGIKAPKGAVDVQVWATKEYVGIPGKGEWKTIPVAFRVYPSLQAAISDYCRFLSKDRYQPAHVFPTDPARFITAVWAAGYATAPSYPKTVVSVMGSIVSTVGHSMVAIDDALLRSIVRLQSVPAGRERQKLLVVEMATRLGSLKPHEQVIDPLDVFEKEVL